MTYDQFRTNLSFAAVRTILDAEAQAKEQRGIRMFITRRTVLGRWHQIKRASWRAYQRRRDYSEFARCSSKQPTDLF